MSITPDPRRHAVRRHIPALCMASIVIALHPVPSMMMEQFPPRPSASLPVSGYEVAAHLCITVRTSPDRSPRAPTR